MDSDVETVRTVARDAHIEARHAWPWEVCPDPVCAAMERWVYARRPWPPVGGYVPLEQPMVRG